MTQIDTGGSQFTQVVQPTTNANGDLYVLDYDREIETEYGNSSNKTKFIILRTIDAVTINLSGYKYRFDNNP